MRAANQVGTSTDGLVAGGVVAAAAVAALLWSGAALSALLSGHRVPRFRLSAMLELSRCWRSPGAAWASPVGSAIAYWLLTVLVFAVAAVAAVAVYGIVRSMSEPRGAERSRDLAGRAEVRRFAGVRALRRRAAVIRPGLAAAVASDIGHRLGRARGVDCWASAEDSMVVVGPPRSGKGLHLAIPLVLDAPGPVITTSTRPDNLTATLARRSARGEVAVFDPQRLAPGITNGVRWHPARGCVRAQSAMVRAKALTAGVARGTTESTYWQASAEQAVRCLLHAAALSKAPAKELYRWSLSPVLASEAVAPLLDDPRAAAGWAQALEAILQADTKQRDAVWAMVTIAFSALADPQVLEAVSPEPGEEFDPEAFLAGDNTLYLLGTSTGAAACSGLVAAFIEDVLETGRRLAASSPGGRLDPPLTVVLDEAANYRLPSLASLMSEGGGSGISTVVVLQSLAQARAVWGDHEGAALWDSAIVKVVLGGGSNTRDLEDLSRLIGTRWEQRSTESVGPDGRRSHSVSSHDTPILKPGELRQLPFGQAVLLLRSAPPILLTLQPWTRRRDAATIIDSQRQLEAQLSDRQPRG